MNAALKYIVPAGVLVGIVLIGLAIRYFLFKYLQRWARKTTTNVDDILIRSIRFPFLLWFILLGIYVLLKTIRVPKIVSDISDPIILGIVILSISLVVANIVAATIRKRGERSEAPVSTTTLTQNVVKGIIIAIGILIFLNALGISITPLITALGVGGLAVALALQDTLSNLFAGINISLSKRIRIGDYIQLDSGQEGYVVDMTWRLTTVRQLPNNMVVIPNTKLAQAIVINYNLPEKEMSLRFQVGVSYDSDLEHVEEVTVDVARQVLQKISGGVPHFDPFIRFHTFDDFSINFTVILRIKEFHDKYLIQHEFVKTLHKRYKEEGIEIPFPIRTLHSKFPVRAEITQKSKEKSTRPKSEERGNLGNADDKATLF
jgi:small-conductance mechanosensitive channel